MCKGSSDLQADKEVEARQRDWELGNIGRGGRNWKRKDEEIEKGQEAEKNPTGHLGIREP